MSYIRNTDMMNRMRANRMTQDMMKEAAKGSNNLKGAVAGIAGAINPVLGLAMSIFGTPGGAKVPEINTQYSPSPDTMPQNQQFSPAQPRPFFDNPSAPQMRIPGQSFSGGMPMPQVPPMQQMSSFNSGWGASTMPRKPLSVLEMVRQGQIPYRMM